ncbi:hypothetical protein GE061_000306 [Apolygus lucorum]|uniref:Uncharacterized protein n=1 Tax=Apolygus lucorum TaxID=248454 RepID=A0A8S9Y5F8_APOLU|nr:hypothetical protein GE061_000306 [Apolygus lucorum]
MRPSSNTCKRARPRSAGSPPAALLSTSAELPMPPPCPHHLRMHVIAASPLPNRGPLRQLAPLISRVKFLEQTSCGESKPAETGAPRSTCVHLLEFRSTHDSDFDSSDCQTSGPHLPNTNSHW